MSALAAGALADLAAKESAGSGAEDRARAAAAAAGDFTAEQGAAGAADNRAGGAAAAAIAVVAILVAAIITVAGLGLLVAAALIIAMAVICLGCGRQGDHRRHRGSGGKGHLLQHTELLRVSGRRHRGKRIARATHAPAVVE